MEKQYFNEQIKMIEPMIGNEKADALCVSSLDSMYKELAAMPKSPERQEMVLDFRRLLLRQTAFEMSRWLRYKKIQGMN